MATLDLLETKAASAVWSERLGALDLVGDILGRLPTEETIERLMSVLDKLASDAKWEVRRATVAALVATGHPAAHRIIEQLASDNHQWVRQAAERGKRKMARITTPGDKKDRRVQFAFDMIKNLKSTAPEKLYEAALRVGEEYYEELAGDTAHELNTFRTVLEGLLSELEQVVSDDEAAVIVAQIRDRCQYLKALVAGLLEYSRDVDAEVAVESIRPLIEEAVALAREKSRITSPHVTLAVPETVAWPTRRMRLSQALTNILSNAFEAGAACPDVVVDVEEQADRLIVKIRDHGNGMAPAQVENAKRRFRSLKKNKGGIGLGLPLAVKIVERELRGRLEIESALGVGTTVTIELPHLESREP